MIRLTQRHPRVGGTAGPSTQICPHSQHHIVGSCHCMNWCWPRSFCTLVRGFQEEGMWCEAT